MAGLGKEELNHTPFTFAKGSPHLLEKAEHYEKHDSLPSSLGLACWDVKTGVNRGLLKVQMR